MPCLSKLDQKYHSYVMARCETISTTVPIIVLHHYSKRCHRYFMSWKWMPWSSFGKSNEILAITLHYRQSNYPRVACSVYGVIYEFQVAFRVASVYQWYGMSSCASVSVLVWASIYKHNNVSSSDRVCVFILQFLFLCLRCCFPAKVCQGGRTSLGCNSSFKFLLVSFFLYKPNREIQLYSMCYTVQFVN